MLPSQLTSALILLTIFSLLVTTSLSASASFPSNPAVENSVRAFVDTTATVDEKASEEEEDDGWFSNAVDTVVESGGDVVSGAKDLTTSGASTVWDAAEEAPGAVWGIVEGAPDAMGGAASDGWNWLRETSSGSVEWGGWADFIARNPLLGAVLGPVVLFLVGLSPHGSISYFEIAIGAVLLLIPLAKAGPVIWKTGESVIPLLPKVDNAMATARKNPGGIVDGVRDTARYVLATTISPTFANFAKLPKSPGVYVARDANGTPLYVGSSGVSLRQRTPQHFAGQPSAWVPHTDSIKLLSTDSAVDARALECRLIKQFMPAFNKQHKNSSPCPIYIEAVAPVIP